MTNTVLTEGESWLSKESFTVKQGVDLCLGVPSNLQCPRGELFIMERLYPLALIVMNESKRRLVIWIPQVARRKRAIQSREEGYSRRPENISKHSSRRSVKVAEQGNNSTIKKRLVQVVSPLAPKNICEILSKRVLACFVNRLNDRCHNCP